jgi:hypothetical protein
VVEGLDLKPSPLASCYDLDLNSPLASVKDDVASQFRGNSLEACLIGFVETHLSGQGLDLMSGHVNVGFRSYLDLGSLCHQTSPKKDWRVLRELRGLPLSPFSLLLKQAEQS